MAQFLSQELTRRTESLLQKPQPETAAECVNIYKVAKKMKVELHLARSQEHLFSLFRKWQADPSGMPALSQETAALFLQLLTELHISPNEFKPLLQSVPGKA